MGVVRNPGAGTMVGPKSSAGVVPKSFVEEVLKNSIRVVPN